MTEEIKGLVDEELWKGFQEVNDDAYGTACIQVARNVMKYLDEHPAEFNIGYYPDMTTPHGIITHCDDAGGITGFMASCVVEAVARCYKDGWKFYAAYAISPATLRAKDSASIDKIRKRASMFAAGTTAADHEGVRTYIVALCKRFEHAEREKKGAEPCKCESGADGGVYCDCHCAAQEATNDQEGQNAV